MILPQYPCGTENDFSPEKWWKDEIPCTLRKAIAIDFDGCLCTDAFPNIGKPNWGVIEMAKRERANGAGLILWTCREGPLLQIAIDTCRKWGLEFDTINESLPDWIEKFGNRLTLARGLSKIVAHAPMPMTECGAICTVSKWQEHMNPQRKKRRRESDISTP